MKLKNLVQESVPKKKKRLKIMITETQLKQLVDVTLLHEGKNLIKKTQLFKILDNEKAPPIRQQFLLMVLMMKCN